MADINSTLPVTDAADGVDGASAPAVSVQIAGKDISGNLQTIFTDSSGNLNINSVSGTVSLPTGASTSALQTTANSSLSSIDTKTPALGQALAAASTPVVLTAIQLAALTPRSYTYFHPIFTTRIQTQDSSNSSNSTTLTQTITATTAGSLLVVTATCVTGTLTIADSGTQTYLTALTTVSGNIKNYMFYVANSAAGVTSVTITCSASTALNIIVTEYANIATSSPLDKTSATVATGLTWTSGSTATTAQATELLLGASHDGSKNNVTFSPGTGWTAVNSIQNGVGASGGTTYQQERYVSSVGAYASTGSISASDLVLAQIATFKLSGAPTNLTYLGSATTIKSGSGILSNVTISTLGAVGSIVSFYDGSVTEANKIAALSLSTSIGSIDFNLTFSTSLLMVVNSNTADFTVVYN